MSSTDAPSTGESSTEKESEKSPALRTAGSESAVALTNRGWRALEQGEPQQAVQCFRRALRLRPEYVHARKGIVEALKARNPLYCRLLKASFWLAGLSPLSQFGLMFAAFLLLRGVGLLVKDTAWAPFLAPLSMGLFCVCILLGLASPLFDVLLRLDPVGEKSLDDEQRRGANLLLINLVAPVPLLIWFAATYNGLGIVACFFLTFTALPMSAIYRCAPGFPRMLMVGVILFVLAMIAPLLACALGFFPDWTNDERVKCITYNVYSLILAQLAATYLITQHGRK